MTKIVRPNLNIEAFAINAQGTERTVFGGTTQSDDLETNLTAGYARGWGIVATGSKPTSQDFNAQGFTATQLISYLFQNGVPEWASNQEYHAGSFINVDGVIYRSLIDNNIGNDPTSSTAEWQSVTGEASTTQAGIVKLSDDIESISAETVPTSKVLSEFAETVITKSDYATKLFESTGYQKLPSGLIIQWGSSSASLVVGGSVAITLPATVTTMNFQPMVSILGSTTASIDRPFLKTGNITNSSFTVYADGIDNASRGGAVFRWIIMGY